MNILKKIFFVVLILACKLSTVAAQKYMTRTGNIQFYSKTPLENIEAVNNQVSSAINLSNGEVAFVLLMKAFTFEKALMQEHFNEKYVESPKFPKANFEGKITVFENLKLSTSPQEVDITGNLTIHGKTNSVSTKALLTTKGNGLNGKCTFNINLADYDINVPAAVKENIAKSIKIIVNIDYEKS